MSEPAGRAASRLRPILIGILSVLVVVLVVAGLVAPNVVSMPLTVRTGNGVTDPGPDPSRATPAVTGPGTGMPGVAGPGRSVPGRVPAAKADTALTAVFGTVGVDGDLAVGTVRFSLVPTGNPLGAVEWTLTGATHYRVEAPISAGRYDITVTATVDGEQHVEQAAITLVPGQPLEVSTLISSAPWLVFFLPVPAY